MKVQTDLMRYLHELRRRAEVDFPPDFAELVEELVANATKRDEQLRAVGLRGRAEGAEGAEGAEAGTSKMPNPWTNQEPGLDMIATEDLDPKIRAGLEKIRKYDEMLLAKEAEQRMVEQETLDRGGDPNEDGEDGKEKDGRRTATDPTKMNPATKTTKRRDSRADASAGFVRSHACDGHYAGRTRKTWAAPRRGTRRPSRASTASRNCPRRRTP
jgi:hypothetical protein